EWDLRRLVTSIWVAGRENGLRESQCEEAVMGCVAAYREVLRELAEQPLLSRSFQRMNVDRLQTTIIGNSLRAAIARASELARARTSDRALPRFTTERGGHRRVVDKPPLVTHVSDVTSERVAAAIDEYLSTLAPHWRRVVGGYTLIDVVHKVVGISSVGLKS